MAENDNPQDTAAVAEDDVPHEARNPMDDMDPAYRAKVENQKGMFNKLEQLSRRRMPTLELIHEKFARTVRLTLFNMIRSPVEVRVHLPMVKTYKKFIDGFPERTNINIVNIRSLKGTGCWCIDPGVIYIAIDNMFGGEGRLAPRTSVKEYTATELRIVRRIMDGLLNEYEKAWKSVHEMKFDFMRQETNFTFAKITSPEEMVMHAKFTIDINGREGDVDLCIPFWVLEPLKGVLYENMQLVSEPDKIWVDKLQNEVQSTPVTAVAVLARKEMLLGDVLSMAVGEIIPIEIVDPVTVYVDGLPVIRGKYGVKNGRYAVKVQSIQRPEEYLKAPLERGRLGPSMMRAEERGDLYERQSARAGETFEAAMRGDPGTVAPAAAGSPNPA
ncbi:MAG: flagellar motor switch protein FliM [Burkholderiaceae bacterium]|nr:flagellar motor switch protein FliM [Burkholderiaceae bacterium]